MAWRVPWPITIEKQRPITHRACRPLVSNRMSSRCQTESPPSLSSTKTVVSVSRPQTIRAPPWGVAKGVADESSSPRIRRKRQRLFYPHKDPLPTYLVEEGAVFIPAEPNEQGFAHDVVFGHEAPCPSIFRVVSIVAHHPVIIHFEGIASGLGTVEVYAVVAGFQLISFIHADGSLVERHR